MNEDFNNNLIASLDNYTEPVRFIKRVSFSDRIKLNNYASDPATCEVGEIAVVGGKVKVCTATDTWTIVGTQT